MNKNYFLIAFGLLVMFAPLIMQALNPDSMYGFYLYFTFLPGLLILAVGLMRSHNDKNNKEYLKPKNKILGKSFNPGEVIIVIIFFTIVVPTLIRYFIDLWEKF